MTPNKLLLEFSGTPLEDLPDEIRAAVEADPALKQQMELHARTAQLISLKQYEQPPEAMEGRVRERLRLRIVNDEIRRPSLDFEAMPNWLRMAAAVVLMFTLSVLTHWEMLQHGEDTTAAVPLGPETIISDPQNNLDYEYTHVDPFTTYVTFMGDESDTAPFPENYIGFREAEDASWIPPLNQSNRLDTSPSVPVLFPLQP